MLKINVRPLASRNNNRPYNSPLSDENRISSSMDAPRRDGTPGPLGRGLLLCVDQVGSTILQVVGTTVSWALITAVVFQPQPVPSSSCFVPEPKDDKYMSWNNE